MVTATMIEEDLIQQDWREDTPFRGEIKFMSEEDRQAGLEACKDPSLTSTL